MASKLDKKFEKMSSECANNMSGTRPPKKSISTKKTVKKVTKKK